jgi:hypothetical protein
MQGPAGRALAGRRARGGGRLLLLFIPRRRRRRRTGTDTASRVPPLERAHLLHLLTPSRL